MGFKTRPAGSQDIEHYVAHAPAWQQELFALLRDLVFSVVPNASLVMKWDAPVFVLESPFAYLGCFSKTVNLGFLRGAHLDDPEAVLRGTGKDGRHVQVRSAEDIDPAVLRPLLLQAASLAA